MLEHTGYTDKVQLTTALPEIPLSRLLREQTPKVNKKGAHFKTFQSKYECTNDCGYDNALLWCWLDSIGHDLALHSRRRLDSAANGMVLGRRGFLVKEGQTLLRRFLRKKGSFSR